MTTIQNETCVRFVKREGLVGATRYRYVRIKGRSYLWYSGGCYSSDVGRAPCEFRSGCFFAAASAAASIYADAKIRNGEYVRMYVRHQKNIVSRGYVES